MWGFFSSFFKELHSAFFCLRVTFAVPETLDTAECRCDHFTHVRKTWNPKTSLEVSLIISVEQRGSESGEVTVTWRKYKKYRGERDDSEPAEQRINETRGSEWARMAAKVRIQIRTRPSASRAPPPLPTFLFSSITEALLENRVKGKAVTCFVNDGEAAMMQF